MKAAVITRYGPPDVVQVRDMPKPAPAKGEVLVRVRATSVNRSDYGELRPGPLRIFYGLSRPSRAIFGMEFAGETMPSSWVIADVHLSNVPNPEEICISWHTDGILAVFPIFETRYRVIADSGLINAGVAPANPTFEDVQSILMYVVLAALRPRIQYG